MGSYAWQAAFESIEGSGPLRIITIFKRGLQEMPRLEKMFLGPHREEQRLAREEILALFQQIEQQMQKEVQASSLSPQEFEKEVRKSSHFTPAEWALLARVPELLGRHHQELFQRRAFKTPKKRNPFFKV